MELSREPTEQDFVPSDCGFQEWMRPKPAFLTIFCRHLAGFFQQTAGICYCFSGEPWKNKPRTFPVNPTGFVASVNSS
jgi:hypothetical protein